MILRSFALSIMVIFSIPAFSGIGTVSENKGNSCEIHRSKAKIAGTKGTDVEAMDTYVTGACSAGITFKDDTKVKVSENSRLTLDDFVYDPKKSDAGKLALKIGAGTVRYASGQIAKNNPQAVDIRTPTATIAVRGTDFSSTVDETGESLIVLLPSCKSEEEKKQYEMDEQRCKVGKIEVSTLSGSVVLDVAFEATYVASSSVPPTPPVIVNLTEGKIGNNLLIVKPQEVQQAIKESKKSKKDTENDDMEKDAIQGMLIKTPTKSESNEAKKLNFSYPDGRRGCDPTKTICVKWEKGGASPAERGNGTAVKQVPNEHYVEVKTQGTMSNTTITVIQNDQQAADLIGDQPSLGNNVFIKQSFGVLRR